MAVRRVESKHQGTGMEHFRKFLQTLLAFVDPDRLSINGDEDHLSSDYLVRPRCSGVFQFVPLVPMGDRSRANVYREIESSSRNHRGDPWSCPPFMDH